MRARDYEVCRFIHYIIGTRNIFYALINRSKHDRIIELGVLENKKHLTIIKDLVRCFLYQQIRNAA